MKRKERKSEAGWLVGMTFMYFAKQLTIVFVVVKPAADTHWPPPIKAPT